MTETQASLFEDAPAEWRIRPGIGGFVAYVDGLATESWNTPSAAIAAANRGEVSKKWHRQMVELQNRQATHAAKAQQSEATQ